jgi:hypothetical protein
MNQTRCLAVGAMALLLATACEQAAVPQVMPTSPSTFSAETQARVTPATVNCTVDIGSRTHSLPLIQLIQAWLNISIHNAASSLSCGQVESLNAKLNVVADKVDQDVPNADAACGASTALVNELQAFIEGGRLATPTFSPPRPGGPTNVLMAAEALKEHWCDAAHGG